MAGPNAGSETAIAAHTPCSAAVDPARIQTTRAAFSSTLSEHEAGGFHRRALTQAVAMSRLTKYFLRAALTGSLSPDGIAQSRPIAYPTQDKPAKAAAR
jgi:hypothetical protein